MMRLSRWSYKTKANSMVKNKGQFLSLFLLSLLICSTCFFHVCRILSRLSRFSGADITAIKTLRLLSAEFLHGEMARLYLIDVTSLKTICCRPIGASPDSSPSTGRKTASSERCTALLRPGRPHHPAADVRRIQRPVGRILQLLRPVKRARRRLLLNVAGHEEGHGPAHLHVRQSQRSQQQHDVDGQRAQRPLPGLPEPQSMHHFRQHQDWTIPTV
jgi:hypothetical protein